MANAILITAHLFVDLLCPHNFITYLSACCRSVSLYGYIKLLYVYYTSFNVDSKMPKCGHLILLNISYMQMHIVTKKYFCFNNTLTFSVYYWIYKKFKYTNPQMLLNHCVKSQICISYSFRVLEVVDQWTDRQTITTILPESNFNTRNSRSVDLF